MKITVNYALKFLIYGENRELRWRNVIYAWHRNRPALIVNLSDHFLRGPAVVLLKRSTGVVTSTALDMGLQAIHPQNNLWLVPIE